MKKILFTLALLISFSSFGQYDLYEITYPEGFTKPQISKKVKSANDSYLAGNYYDAIDLFTKIINTYNIDPLVKANTLYYRAMANKAVRNEEAACNDLYNVHIIFYENVKYWNSPHLHNNGKPNYIPVGWGETGYLYRWGCVSKKMMKTMDKGYRKVMKQMKKQYKKYGTY
jgi:hypothetical protein